MQDKPAVPGATYRSVFRKFVVRPQTPRSLHGITLIEFSAAMAVGLPLILTALYVVLEANFLFTIRVNIDAAVRRWAQVAINTYETNGANQTAAEAAATAAVNIPHFVSPHVNQFVADWDTTNRPYSVTVTCTYPAGGSPANDLPPFPFPDPLKLGHQFSIQATGTFPLNPD
jgi:hypothetical protein